MTRLGPATLTVLIVAVLVGLGGAYGVRQLTRVAPVAVVPRKVEPPKARKYRVPLALTDLPAYRKIVMSDVTTSELTMEEVRKRGLPPDASLDYRFVMGRILRTPVKAFEPFPISNFYPAGVEPSLSDRIKPGLRAVTLAVKAADSAGGFATPGSIVDVVFRRGAAAIRSNPAGEPSFVLLQQVDVLALGDSAFPGEPPKKAATTVTLALTPEQVALVELVEGHGDLSLVLRGPPTTGDTPHVLERAELERLLGLNVPPPPPPPPQFTADIFRGAQKQSITFARPDSRATKPKP